MEFEIAGIFSRSVTIERNNTDRFETEEECIVNVNGKEYVRTKRNVITIDGLDPEHKYKVSVCSADGNDHNECAVQTKSESILLNVRSFGALGDGMHNDTPAIQAAIMGCPDDGTVYVPAGTYLTGPLFLKSHMTLWIDEGAVLLGDTDRANYPVLPGMVRDLYDNDKEYNLGSWEGNPLDSFASLITVINAEDISVIGRGIIDGNAANSDWWVDAKKKRTAWRPNLVNFIRCKNIRMQGLTLKNSACWCIHPYYSESLSFMDLTIQNPSDSPNTDGFDPESCEDVTLLGTTISVGDDCIALKSGKLYMAKYHHRETKNVTIRNCRLEKGHGSVTIGSEIAGGVSNVHVSRCIFAGTDRGVRIKTRRGRGERSILTDLFFENITMDHVHMPLTVNMFYFCDPDGHTEYVQSQEECPVDYRTPKVGSISIKNVDCTGVDASFVCAVGLPEAPVEKISLENINVSYLEEDKRIPQRPVMMDGFPEMSGRSIYLKNVNEIEIKKVSIKDSADNDIMYENVKSALIDGLLL